MTSCHDDAERSGIRSSSHEVTGTVSGVNEDRSCDPLNRRRDPGSCASAIDLSNPSQTIAAADVRPLNLRRFLRARSVVRGVVWRAKKCQTRSGTSRSAEATCTHRTVKGPM